MTNLQAPHKRPIICMHSTMTVHTSHYASMSYEYASPINLVMLGCDNYLFSQGPGRRRGPGGLVTVAPPLIPKSPKSVRYNLLDIAMSELSGAVGGFHG